MMMFYRLLTSLSRSHKQAIFTVCDALAVVLALFAACMLHDYPFWQSKGLGLGVMVVCALVVASVLAGWAIGLPRIKLNAYESQGIVKTAAFSVISAAFIFASCVFAGAPLPVTVVVSFTLLILVFCASWRIALRYVTWQIYRKGEQQMRVLIYGAGQTGQQLVAALRQDNTIEAVAFVDDNPRLQGEQIGGLKVYGPAHIKGLITSRKIDRVVLAMPSVKQAGQARIAYKLRTLGCEIHALPSVTDFMGDPSKKAPESTASMTDLLGRDGLDRDLPRVSHAYTDRSILITGAGGTIGSELCRQIADCAPRVVVLVDNSELALYRIDRELKEVFPYLNTVPVLGSILDDDHMLQLMMEHKTEVVLHAAAYKHVPLVEINPIAGLRNNVLGTKALADAARDAGVDRFILVSSDKAVRPTNVMGASKRLAEMVVQDLSTRAGGTRYAMVRFGNVMGSSGSVVPLFERQIMHGGPVTLTHNDVTRFFMTVQEAARLVLLAGSFSRGGDVFVLDMGEPVKIKQLAQQMILGAGYSVKSDDNPDGDIEITEIGMRPGEKLHEELLITQDMLTTPHPKILRAQEGMLSEFELATALKELRTAIDQRNEVLAREAIGRWVETAKVTAAPKGGSA